MSHLPTYYDIAAMVEQAVARQEGRGQEAAMVDHEEARQDSRQVGRGPPEFRQAVRGLPTNIRQDIRGLPGSRQDAHRLLHGAHQEFDGPLETRPDTRGPTELLREARGFPMDIRPEFQGPPVIRRDSRDALHGNRPPEQALEEGEVRGEKPRLGRIRTDFLTKTLIP